MSSHLDRSETELEGVPAMESRATSLAGPNIDTITARRKLDPLRLHAHTQLKDSSSHSPGPRKTRVVVKDVAYATYRAVLYYVSDKSVRACHFLTSTTQLALYEYNPFRSIIIIIPNIKITSSTHTKSAKHSVCGGIKSCGP